MSTTTFPNASTATSTTESHAVVTHDRWIAARKQLLAREKALTSLGDEVARERRALPWVRIDKDYVFDTPQGPRSLADCFDGRSQLIVQHLMFAPGWENACKSCSFMADHTDPTLPHLAQRDVSFIAVSRAPVADIERFKARMGWGFDWVSSQRSDFNFDFNVSFTPEERARGETYYNFGIVSFGAEEMPGVSVFLKDEDGTIYLTYSTYGRGVEVMMHTYRFLDLLPKGRDEEGLEHSMSWVMHHDRYPKRPGRVDGGTATTAAAVSPAAPTGDCCARG
ncbi:thioredoxin [Roseateles aquatilis]|uniref:Thioredoxin n=1 Tax=Roseateles aquatilis TaxID=431061 RepID=A0A246JCI3_9BURK|nr:thioredoxin family protein [Roseateles aquatilis]OWQ90353.1 thioredoxin [Roseateles aquatilis]